MGLGRIDRHGREEQEDRMRMTGEDRSRLSSRGINVVRDFEGEVGADRWRWESDCGNFPQQTNGWDCGIFTTVAGLCGARGWDAEKVFQHVTAKEVRKWLLRTILSDSEVVCTKMCQECGLAVERVGNRADSERVVCVDKESCKREQKEWKNKRKGVELDGEKEKEGEERQEGRRDQQKGKKRRHETGSEKEVDIAVGLKKDIVYMVDKDSQSISAVDLRTGRVTERVSGDGE